MTGAGEAVPRPPRPGRPTWRRLSECPRCILHRRNLRRTALTALVVGTVLFLINHLVPLLEGRAGTATWVATGVSFVVPFCVANLGVLVASREPAPAGRRVGPRPAVAPPPTWCHLGECLSCVLYGPYLRRTVATALVVGSAYFLINQLDVVAGGHATTEVWVASGVTYLVPFVVSNIGVLVGARIEPRFSSAGGRGSPRGLA